MDGITSGINDRVFNESFTVLTCEGEAPGSYITCHELDADSTITMYDVKSCGGPAPGVASVVEHIVIYEGPPGTSDPPLPPNDQDPRSQPQINTIPRDKLYVYNGLNALPSPHPILSLPLGHGAGGDRPPPSLPLTPTL